MSFFFSFFLQNTVGSFFNGKIRKKKEKKEETASNVLLRQTNIANKIREIFVNKVLVFKLDPPKNFDKSTRLTTKIPRFRTSEAMFCCDMDSKMT